jgi:hypothetical protein
MNIDRRPTGGESCSEPKVQSIVGAECVGCLQTCTSTVPGPSKLVGREACSHKRFVLLKATPQKDEGIVGLMQVYPKGLLAATV